MNKEKIQKVTDAFFKWLPVIGTAIISSIFDEKKKEKEKNELKEEIIKELTKREEV